MNLTLSQLDILISLLDERLKANKDKVPLIYHRLHNQLLTERKKREDLIR